MRHFVTDFELGREGVTQLTDYLRRNGYTYREHGRDEQHKGDLTVELRSGQSVTVEVKRDAKAEMTGNLFLETWSNFPAKAGWVETCEADALAYVLPNQRIAYLMKFADLRDVLSQLFARSPKGEVQQGTARQKNVTKGYPVPIEAFRELVESFKEIRLC